jgi:membrane protein implicated in regulation of membrane protease activity
MDGFSDIQWLLWVALALALGVTEMISVDFVFLMFAGGALSAAAAAGLGAPLSVSVIVFALSSALLLFGVRPPLKRWAVNSPAEPMNAAALVGREARVVERVTDMAGLIKLAGEMWSARVESGGHTLEPGSTVRVIRIDGATAVVAAESIPLEGPTEGRSHP